MGDTPEGAPRAPSVEEQLRSVVDNADLVLWGVDAHGNFTLSEGRGLRTLGLRPGQVVGMSAFEVYRDNPTICEAIRKGLAGDRSRWIAEVGGRVFETQALPLAASDATLTRLMGVSWDITERRKTELENQRLQAQLLQVQKLESLGVLAGGIAHDFNNWLAAILGSASVVLLRLPMESPLRAQLDNVITAATRAANLTKQLLAYAGKGSFEIRPVDLSAHVRELAAVLETTVSRRVQIRLELDPALPAIEVDVGQLQQIIMNLVLNGAEAIGDAAGTVLITTGVQDVDAHYAQSLFASEGLTPGRYVFLEVHDTGCGMDDATRQKIFDPFFTTKFHGRGLGLAAVLGIVRGHKGGIKVYSTPGRGTTFKVFFPASTQAALEDTKSERTPLHGEGLVLVIDDDENVRGALRDLLQHFGFSVVEARDGREGIQVFERVRERCKVVLLDMTMPDMGGEETFRKLRSIADTPVILMSGYNEVEATRRFAAKGLAGFLQKPFTADELAQRVRRALEGHAS